MARSIEDDGKELLDSPDIGESVEKETWETRPLSQIFRASVVPQIPKFQIFHSMSVRLDRVTPSRSQPPHPTPPPPQTIPKDLQLELF